MKKSWKKLIVGLFVFALVLSGMNLLLFGESKVQAEETSVKYYVQPYSGEQVSAYKTAKKVPSPTPEAGKEKYNDWIFAGWFTNDACSNALVNTIDAESTYYAKYVPAEVLSVKAQVKKDTVKETDKTDLRLVATVDSLQYKKVGFEIYYAGSSNPVVVNTTTVYERIEAAKDGVDYGFSPNIFDVQSEYFVTATLKNIANKNYDKDFYIKPYWETLDGTTVYGASRHARVEDSYLGIVNVPVRVVSDAATATTGSVNVAYNTTYFTYADSYESTLLNDITTSTPGYANGEVFDSVTVDGTTAGIVAVTGSAADAQRVNGEVVHLRFKTNADVTLLKKNVFTVTSSDLTQGIVVTNTVYYDFNNTVYNGVADTSWFDKNEAEFVITTPAELYGFASLVNAGTFGNRKVYLASNIKVNASVLDANGALVEDTSGLKNWVPIGIGTAFTLGVSDFQGSFDGQGHTISGLYTDLVTNPGSHTTGGWKSFAAGLFGSVYTNTEIKNVKIVDSYFKASDYAGGVVGVLKNGTVDNVYSKATVETSASCAGGIVGGIRGGSASEISVIKNSWFAGTAKGAKIVAGICGRIHTSSGQVNNCLNEGTIIATGDTAGGIIGEVNATVSISDCFNVGNVTGTSLLGTVMGNTAKKVTVDDIYALTQGETKTVGGGSVSNAKEMTSIDTASGTYGYAALTQMSGLDYADTWVVRQSGTPVLKNWCQSDALYTPDTDWAGTGSEKDPWIIKTANELYGLAQLVNAGEPYTGKYFELGANITINSGAASNWGETSPKYTWIPIGLYKTEPAFKGHFNVHGAIREIKGLYVNRGTNDYAGLFGSVIDGAIQNIKLTNSYVQGNCFVGAICGYAKNATINTTYSNAIVKGTIANNSTNAGGILGYQVQGTVSNSWSDGVVEGTGATQYTGGVVGRIADASGAVIDNCLATGSVVSGRTTGNAYLGGILGGATHNVSISNCFSAVTILDAKGATGCIGSIVGGAGTKGYTVTVSQCYAGTKIEKPTHGTEGAGSIKGTFTALENYTGGYGYLNTYLTFERYETALPMNEQHDGIWVAREGKAPGLKCFVDSKDVMELVGQNLYRADTSWHNNTDAEFTLNNAEEFVGFASLVNSGTSFAGKKVYLDEDITLNVGKSEDWFNNKNVTKLYSWTPIGSRDVNKSFDGEFDGNGHTIEGVYAAGGSKSGIALFGQTKGNTRIANFKLKNSYFTGGIATAAIGGWPCAGIIENIYTDAYVRSANAHAAGLVGRAGLTDIPTTIKNCWYAGTVYSTASYVGGITSFIEFSNITIESCLNSGQLTGSSEIGGMIGRTAADTIIKDSLNIGSMTSTTNSLRKGAIIGWPSSGSITCENVYALGADTVLYPTVAGTATAGGSVAGTCAGVANLTGANGFLNTWLSFDRPELPTPTTGKWVAVDGGTPVLKDFVEESGKERLTLTGQNMYRVDTRWYDESKAGSETIDEVTYTTYTINTAEELLGFAKLVDDKNYFATSIVYLGKDIVLNTGDAKEWSAGNNVSNLYSWNPIGTYTASPTTTNSFSGIFDGQGRSISGLYAVKAGSGMGLFENIAGSAVVKNVSLVNSYFQAHQYAGGIAGMHKGQKIENVYTDVRIHLTGTSGGVCGGIAGAFAAGTIEKCQSDAYITSVSTARYLGGIAGVSNGGTQISNSLFSGTLECPYNGNAYVGGITGVDQAALTISDCLVAADKITSTSLNTTGSVVGSNGDGESQTHQLTLCNVYATSDIEGGTNAIGRETGHDTRGQTTLSGEVVESTDFDNYKAYMNTNLDFDNVWIAMENGAPNLQVFAPETGRFDTTSWYTKATIDSEGNAVGTEANPYIIDTIAEMYGLAKRVNSGNSFEGLHIKLGADLTFNTDTDFTKEEYVPEYKWTPIGTTIAWTNYDYAFKGVFDGDHNTISGLYSIIPEGASGSYTKGGWFVSLFGWTYDATIKNVRVEESYFQATNYAAPAVGFMNLGRVDSVYTEAIVTSTSGHSGGVVGGINGATIRNCWSASDVSAPKLAGGIADVAINQGTVSSSSTIEHCLFTGTVNVTNAGQAVGGILAQTTNSAVITDNLSAGIVTSAGANKGIVVGYQPATVQVQYTSTYGYNAGVENGATNAVGSKNPAGTNVFTDLQAVYDTQAYNKLDVAYWTARVGDVPIPSVFAKDDDYAAPAMKGSTYAIDMVLAGSGTAEDPYKISSAAELYGFSILSKADTFEGKYVELTNDIVVNPVTINKDDAKAVYYDWNPIGKSTKAFAGTFDGNGYTISGLYKVWDQYDEKIALFADTAETSTIKDFYIKNTRFQYDVVQDKTRVASVAGRGAGTFESIYSDASLQSGGYGTGGIIGAVDTGNATVTNCWYNGDMTLLVDKNADSVSTFAGGIVGLVAGRDLTIQHSLFSGSLMTEGRRIGGLVGSVHNSGEVASTFVSNDNLVTGKVIGNGTETGIIIGRVYSDNDNALCQATLNNTFGVCDYASYDVQAVTKSTVTGSAYISHSKDRFIGFMGENATLDFSVWTLMNESAPMLKSFVEAGKMNFGTKNTSITSVDDVKAIIDPTNAYNFATPVHKGAGEYLFTVTGKNAADFANYCATLTAFTKVSSNTIENVLNNVYTSGDYTLNATFANGTIYVTFSTAQTLSEHLKGSVDYTQKEGIAADGYTAAPGEISAVTFHMVEQKYYQANCYIIRLTNGHFIVIDGGMPKHDGIVPAEFFYEYLEALVPEGKKPIVEAWVVSHAHEDHIGIFETIYGDAIAKVEDTKNYAGRIYVEGIYFNEPNDAVVTTYAEGHHRLIAALKMATTKLKTSAGKTPKIYSMLTGQRYTFDAVTMDILEAQEVLSKYSSEGGNEAFNDTSTWTLFTINGKKVLTAGDSSEYGIQFINNTYSKSFLQVDIFTALHHGLNTGRYTSGSNLTNYLTVTGVILYTNQYDMTKSSSGHPEAGQLVFTRNESLVGKSALKGISVDGTTRKYLYYGQGTCVLTFKTDNTISATVLPKNDWVLGN